MIPPGKGGTGSPVSSPRQDLLRALRGPGARFLYHGRLNLHRPRPCPRFNPTVPGGPWGAASGWIVREKKGDGAAVFSRASNPLRPRLTIRAPGTAPRKGKCPRQDLNLGPIDYECGQRAFEDFSRFRLISIPISERSGPDRKNHNALALPFRYFDFSKYFSTCLAGHIALFCGRRQSLPFSALAPNPYKPTLAMPYLWETYTPAALHGRRNCGKSPINSSQHSLGLNQDQSKKVINPMVRRSLPQIAALNGCI